MLRNAGPTGSARNLRVLLRGRPCRTVQCVDVDIDDVSSHVPKRGYASPPAPSSSSSISGSGPGSIAEIAQTLGISSLVKAFRDRGHLVAKLDPLGRALGPLKDNSSLSGTPSQGDIAPENAEDLFLLLKDYPHLNLGAVGLQGVDPHKRFFLGGLLRIVRATQVFWTVEEVVALLRNAYCGTSTAEYSHLGSKEQKQWMHTVLEIPLSRPLFTPLQQITHLHHLLYAECFESFLGRKFPSSKRFGIEGAESLVVGLHWMMHEASSLGVSHVELGMSHRGRLSVLHAVLGKPLGGVLAEFKSPVPKRVPGLDHLEGELLHVGDVKYHLGTRSTLEFGKDKVVHVSLSPNPSHLEAVNAVVVGKTRAKQLYSGDTDRSRCMGLLLHGDAAFSGLGIAPEVLQLADLPEYTTGGTIHVIVNNQIGFTTDPKLARSSPHPTDFAKAVGAPIFHVNGDDPEAVAHMCALAVRWRQKFHRDVVVDIVCYRRHGHNEQDDPRVTQPLMYQAIRNHPRPLDLYSHSLLLQGVITPQEVSEKRREIEQGFEREWEQVDSHIPTPQDWLAANWQGQALGSAASDRTVLPTGLPLKTLHRVGAALSHTPQGFNVHPQVRGLMQSRADMMSSGEGINWALAEALAFGSLLLPSDPELGQTEGSHPAHPVRLSGQDCERGTFNQRHAVLYDQHTGERLVPLNHILEWEEARGGRVPPRERQESMMVCNSSLSEAAVLGFEYGFSLENEDALVLWEAQFGDFCNNAQSMVDNFVASGEDKWSTPTGLVLLLPHGYDGQGPEHSSARLERFLQLCNDDPDHLPGTSPQTEAQIEAGFKAADTQGKGYLTEQDILSLLEAQQHMQQSTHTQGMECGERGNKEGRWETVRKVMMELGLVRRLKTTGEEDIRISIDQWRRVMVRWMRRNAELDNNLCVVNLTTPANYFHALRRQVNRNFSKPLVVMSPKSLLHHKACASSLPHFTEDTVFCPVILDGDPADNLAPQVQHGDTEAEERSFSLVPPQDRRRLILCSGKVFYLLAHARRVRQARDIGILRIEQIAPLAADAIASAIEQHSNSELVWVQEEPKNMGAWSYIQPRVGSILRTLCPSRENQPLMREIRYVGRAASASTATGSFHIHQLETKAIIEEAMSHAAGFSGPG